MATQEEIIQQYQEDRNRKLLQLQTTLSSRTAQVAKRSAYAINDVSIISTTAVADDLMPKERILSYQNGQDTQFVNDLRKEFVSKNSIPNEPFVYLTVFHTVGLVSNDTFNVITSQVLFFRNAGSGTDENIENARAAPKKIQADSFSEFNKELSDYSFPIELIFISERYVKYLDLINNKLKSLNISVPIESFPILVYSQIFIPDGTETSQFSTIFPKPDGYIGGAVPSIPTTPSVPSVSSVPNVPNIPTTSPIPSSVPSIPGTTTNTPETPKNGNKYLSIEAIKDDDPTIQNQPSSSNVISLRFIDDKEINDYYNSNRLTSIKTKTAESKQNKAPVKSTGDLNSNVIKNEKKNTETKTAAQKRLEDSDSIVKEKPKQKSSTSPSGGNPNNSDGKQEAQEEKRGPIPEDKKPEQKKQSGRPKAKTFIAWMAKEGVDPNGIIYRGTKAKDYTKGSKPPVTYGLVERRFKNLFNFGMDLDGIFSGYSINSPIDVALLMNSGGLGRFNKNWPYMFGEGSEIHASITRNSNIELKPDGGFGNFGAGRDFYDANWAANPHWCGLCTNFMLYTNGKYKSDDDLSVIVSTASVLEYYKSSPFNPENSENEKTKLIKPIDEKIKMLEKDRANFIAEIEFKEKKGSRKAPSKLSIETKLQRRIDELLADTTATGGDINSPIISNDLLVKTERVNLKKINDEIQNLVNKNNEIDLRITELQKEKENIQNQPFQKYIESNNVAKFSAGIHWNKNGLTPDGKELYEKIKMWPGGYIVRRTPGKSNGHVETLLHFTPRGELYTIGGNTGLENSDGNGSEYGFKYYDSISKFNGSFEWFFVVKRGSKSPYTNGIGVSVKQTETYKKYVKDLDDDAELNPAAYNILRNIMEI